MTEESKNPQAEETEPQTEETAPQAEETKQTKAEKAEKHRKECLAKGMTESPDGTFYYA